MMAVASDLDRFKTAMYELENVTTPQCRYVEQICITRNLTSGLFYAEFDCDLTICFDDILYSSNNLYFLLNGERVAHICHSGLKPSWL